MAEVLLDSNVFGRYLNPDDSGYAATRATIRTLIQQGHTLSFVPQVAYELHCFMTKQRHGRGTDVNGFGWGAAEAAKRLAQIEEHFTLRFPDPLLEYAIFRDLVRDLEVSGTRVHDIRLVASARALGIRRFVTLDATHFKRAAEAGHIELITPGGSTSG